MKRLYVLLLAMLLVLTGCAGKERTKDASARKTICPYKIEHKRDFVEITLRDRKKQGFLWEVQMMPEEVCKVTQRSSGKGKTAQYRITAQEAGAAQVTFIAAKQDQPDSFILNMMVNVDEDRKVTVTAYQHQELQNAVVEEDGMNYMWNVDTNGVLHFAFMDEENRWYITSDENSVCTLFDKLATPDGCEFSARAKGEGKTSVGLICEKAQRQINIVIEADEDGNLEVTSVQEQ